MLSDAVVLIRHLTEDGLGFLMGCGYSATSNCQLKCFWQHTRTKLSKHFCFDAASSMRLGASEKLHC